MDKAKNLVCITRIRGGTIDSNADSQWSFVGRRFLRRQCTLGGMKGATLIAEEAQEEGRRKKSETVVPLVEQFACKILANSIRVSFAATLVLAE